VRIEQLRKRYKIETRWSAFPLHPETPEEGLTLEELFAGRAINIKKILSHLKQVADDLGLPLSEREKTYNSRLAQELAKWAESQGRGDPYHEAVFRAYFVNGKNIGNMDELVDLTKSIGLPEKEARSVLELRTLKEAVDSDWWRSRVLGITAVPTFVVDHQVVIGFQPYEVLEQFLETCGAEKHNR
jgi:predicted DsbA family dithiol-disulfide isomerase